MKDSKVNPPLHVKITREMFSHFFVLETVDGTEELETEDTLAWFRARGANMDGIQAALDHCWNFLKVEVEIVNPKTPSGPRLPHAPDI